MNEVTKNITEAYLQVLKGKPDLDEAKKLDSVDSKELKGTHAQRKDKDIDNDGDVDSSDEYLHNRRKTVAKAIKKESFDISDYTVEEIKDFIMSEEFDQLDELSKATLGSYIKKSTGSVGGTAAGMGSDAATKGMVDPKKAHTINKRMSGISRATDRLTKEEVEELDELSKKTLGSYVKKATGDAVTKAYKAGDVRDKDTTKNYMKALGRQIGISKATSKLTKEEVEELDEEKKLKFAISKNAKTNGYGIAQWTNYTWWYHSDNTKKYFKTAADAKKYIENVWGKGHTIEINESVNLDEVSNTVKDQLRNIDLEISRLNSRYGSGDIGDTGSMSAPAKIQRLTKQKQDIMKKHGIKEEVNLDEVSKDTLGRYAAKALNRGDMANRMSKSDDDGMGQIAGKRLAGVKKAVDKLADKTGKKALARSIKKDVDTAKASGNAFARGDGVDDQGKSYYKAARNIGKMREEVELDEAQKLFMFKTKAEADKKAKEVNGKVVSLTKQNFAVVAEEIELDEAAQPKWKVQIGKKHYTVTAPSTSVAGQKAKVLADKEGNRGVPAGISRIAEEVKLDEMRTPFVVIDTADGNKVVAMASDEKGARQSVNSAERPPMSIKDKSTLKVIKSNKKQFIGRPLNEQSKPTANYGPKDDTRDTFDKQLATRKGEENFVDMHKIETPEYADAYSVNDKTFKALRMGVSNPKRRWNDLDIGDKKPVLNDGK